MFILTDTFIVHQGKGCFVKIGTVDSAMCEEDEETAINFVCT